MEGIKGVRQRELCPQVGRRGDGDKMSKDVYVCVHVCVCVFCVCVCCVCVCVCCVCVLCVCVADRLGLHLAR